MLTNIFFYLLLASRVCFNRSSLHIFEHQQSLMDTIVLTNPLPADTIITLITRDGTATGEFIVYFWLITAC